MLCKENFCLLRGSAVFFVLWVSVLPWWRGNENMVIEMLRRVFTDLWIPQIFTPL